jgi:hypothetical protein
MGTPLSASDAFYRFAANPHQFTGEELQVKFSGDFC